MLRQAVRPDRLKEIVLQDELVCVCPVVGYLARVVVAHDVFARLCFGLCIAGTAFWVVGAAGLSLLVRFNEAIHAALIDVSDRSGGAVRATEVRIVGILTVRAAAVRRR